MFVGWFIWHGSSISKKKGKIFHPKIFYKDLLLRRNIDMHNTGIVIYVYMYVLYKIVSMHTRLTKKIKLNQMQSTAKCESWSTLLMDLRIY